MTHLFNAMAPLHHREPGLVGAALADPRLRVGLIADGIHVDPSVVGLAQQALGPRLTLVTDAVAAMGRPPGPHGRVTLGDDGVRLADGTLAGSALSMDQAVRNLVAFTGCDPAEALHAASEAPAAVLADPIRGTIRAGNRADLVLLTPQLEVVATVVAGTVVHRGEPSAAAPVIAGVPDRGGSRGRHWEVRVLGGLTAWADGEPVPLPPGAVATTVALLALRRAVHVEELTDVLWPEAAPEVAKRRLRNVLSRVRTVAPGLLVRRPDSVALADEVVVDNDEVAAEARHALALPPGPARSAALAGALDRCAAPFLPEALYAEWAEPARQEAEARRATLQGALAAAGGG